MSFRHSVCVRRGKVCESSFPSYQLTADIPGSVLRINPEGIKTVSGIFQEYAERLLNERGDTKFAFRVLSAP